MRMELFVLITVCAAPTLLNIYRLRYSFSVLRLMLYLYLQVMSKTVFLQVLRNSITHIP
jgi:hypothetical protein